MFRWTQQTILLSLQLLYIYIMCTYIQLLILYNRNNTHNRYYVLYYIVDKYIKNKLHNILYIYIIQV